MAHVAKVMVRKISGILLPMQFLLSPGECWAGKTNQYQHVPHCV